MPGFTIAQALVESAQILRKAGVAESRRDAASLLSYIIGRDLTYLIAHADAELSMSDASRFREFTERRAGGEPLQYVLGHQDFYNLEFEVAPGVLIPRPETEILVEKTLSLIGQTEEPLICDVGTGSGCIIISLLHDRPGARGVALDISPKALNIAKRNADRLEVSNRLDLRESDCFAAVTANERFDFIVANPPYVPEGAYATLQREVRDHEPVEALVSGPDGLNMIRRLLRDAWDFANPNGYFLFEMGFDQNEGVLALVSQSKWRLTEVLDDLQSIPRIVVLQKTE
jgi:release factor glutamine methyltransferase